MNTSGLLATPLKYTPGDPAENDALGKREAKRLFSLYPTPAKEIP